MLRRLKMSAVLAFSFLIPFALILAHPQPTQPRVRVAAVTNASPDIRRPLEWKSFERTTTTAIPPRPAYQPSRSYNRYATVAFNLEAFRRCVMLHESTNNYYSVGGGMYGIIDSTWQGHDASHPVSYAAEYGVNHSWLAPPADQDAAFYDLFRRDGVGPWRRYDGC